MARPKTDGPRPNWDVPIALTPEEWGLIISVLQDRRRTRYDRIITRIHDGLSGHELDPEG